MGLFNRHKKKSFILNDQYTVRFELDDEFKPENNSKVKEIFDDVSNTEKNEGIVPLNESEPFASFKSIEDLFAGFRELAATTAKPVTFSYFAVWELDDSQKVKPGKTGSSDGNPHEFITLKDFSVDYDYQNLTKSLFEEIFNDEDNEDISYDEKVSYCKTLANAYLASTNLSESDVAEMPSEEEAESGTVSLTIPSFADLEQDQESEEKDGQDTAPVYDPVSGTFAAKDTSDHVSEEAAAPAMLNDDEPKPQTVMIKKSDPKEQVIQDAPKKMDTYNSRTEKRAVDDSVDQAVNEARAKGHVEAPQFAIEELDPVSPGNNGYVEYQLNQKKKTLNKLLQNAADKLNRQNEKVLLNRRNKYNQEIQDALAAFNKRHDNDANKLHDRIEAETQEELESRRNTEFQKIDDQAKTDKAEAKRAYEKNLEQIDETSKKQKSIIQQKLDKEYTDKALTHYDEVWQKQEKQTQANQAKLEKELNRRYEIKAQEDASQVQANANAALQELLKKCSEQLDETRTTVTNEDVNARQTLIAQNRAQAEKNKVEYPHDEIKQLNEQISSLKASLATAETAKNASDESKASLKVDYEEATRKIEALRKENDSLKRENSTKEVSQSNHENSNTISKMVELMVAQNLSKANIANTNAPQDVNTSSTNSAENKDQNNEQITSMVKGVRRLLISFIVVLLLVVAGFSGFTLYQNHQHKQQVAALNEEMVQKVSAVRNSQPLSQEESNKKALNALHSSNAAELQKYKNESYYELDKAIIENNPQEVDSAVNSMNSLKMNDRYRASQAATLLQQANNSELANKVTQANK